MNLFADEPRVNLLPCDGTVNYFGRTLLGKDASKIGKEKTPSFALINLGVLCVLPHAQVPRNMQILLRKPNSDHLL